MKRGYRLGIIAVVIVAVGVGGFLFISDVFGLPLPSFSTVTAGYCTLSVDEVTYDYEHFIGDEAWIIDGMTGTCGEEVIGGSMEITPDQLTDEYVGEEEPENAFVLSNTKEDMWLERAIHDGNYDIYDFNWEYFTDKDDCYDWVEPDGPDEEWMYDEFCVGETSYIGDDWFTGVKVQEMGRTKQWDATTTAEWELEFKNCVGSSCATGALVESDGTEIAELELYGENKALLEYLGTVDDEVKGVSLADYKPIYIEDDGFGGDRDTGLIIVHEEDWDSYKYYAPSPSPYGLEDNCKSYDDADDCASEANVAVFSVTTLATDRRDDLVSKATNIHDIDTYYDGYVEGGGRVEMRGENLFEVDWRLSLSADDTWVGVDRVDDAEPKITDYPGVIELQEVEGTDIDVDVENVGGESGTIETSVTCPTPFTGDSDWKTISPGSTERYTLHVSSTNFDEEIYDTCTIKAQIGAVSDEVSVGINGYPSPDDPQNPNIDDISATDFVGGEEYGEIDVDVENTGDGGTIDVDLNCDHPIYSVSGGGSQYVDAGSTERYGFMLQAHEVSNTQDVSCTVEAQGGPNFDSETTEMTVHSRADPPKPIPWMYIIGGAVLIVIGIAYVVL